MFWQMPKLYRLHKSASGTAIHSIWFPFANAIHLQTLFVRVCWMVVCYEYWLHTIYRIIYFAQCKYWLSVRWVRIRLGRKRRKQLNNWIRRQTMRCSTHAPKREGWKTKDKQKHVCLWSGWRRRRRAMGDGRRTTNNTQRICWIYLFEH